MKLACKTERLIAAPVLVGVLVYTLGCNKPAELGAADSGMLQSMDEAGAGTDGGASSTSDAGSKAKRPRNLGIEHGTTLLRPKLDACYATALGVRPTETGSTDLTIVVSADGHVKEAKVSPSSLSNETLDCLRHTTEAFVFTPPDEESKLVLPLYFDPKLAIKPDSGAGGDAGDAGVRRRARDGGAAR
jgi:hypothetical protein